MGGNGDFASWDKPTKRLPSLSLDSICCMAFLRGVAMEEEARLAEGLLALCCEETIPDITLIYRLQIHNPTVI